MTLSRNALFLMLRRNIQLLTFMLAIGVLRCSLSIWQRSFLLVCWDFSLLMHVEFREVLSLHLLRDDTSFACWCDEFLSFIEPIFAWNVPLVSLIFLKSSLVFLILLFSSISLHWLLRKAFLSLLAILWNSAFKWEYLSFSLLLFASLLFTAICKASSDNHFAFLHFFSMGMVLIPVSSTVSQTSILSSSGTLYQN